VPPVYVEVAMEQAAGQLEGDTGRRLISEEVFDLAVGSLNLFQQPLRQDVRARIGEYDVFCMQEVTPSTLPAILSAGRELGYDVVSPAQRGHSTLEGFDVCMLLRNATVTRLRVGVVPLTAAGVRHLLHVQVQVTKNGACLALATAHCTASAEFAAQRASEMEVVWNALEALPVGGCIFAGDTNTHASEKMPERYQERWQDAWEADGAEVTLSGTWCHDWMDTSHPSVQAWRFDRCFFLSRAFRRAVPEDEGAGLENMPQAEYLRVARAADCGQEAAHVGSLPTAEQPSHSVAAASNDATVLSVGRPVDVQSASAAACLVATGKDAAFLPVLPTVEQQGQSQSSVAASSNATLLSAAKPAAGATAQSVLEDTSANRASVAEQHGFPWQPAHGEMRYSVQEACQGKKPTPKRLQLELYLEAILGVDAAFLPADAIALQHVPQPAGVDAAFLPVDASAPQLPQLVPTKSLREKTKTECRTRMMML
ncbi:unnamed protein product, partial [Effrenium voratum]